MNVGGCAHVRTVRPVRARLQAREVPDRTEQEGPTGGAFNG